MQEQKNIRRELREQEADHLLKQQGRIPKWELPAGYLEELTSKVLTSAAAPKERRIVRLLSYWKLTAAAVVLLALGCWYWYPVGEESAVVASDLDWSGISTEELQSYVTSNIEEFEIGLLAEGTEGEIVPIPGSGISTEALEQYLEDEDWLNEVEVTDLFRDNI